ncbi:hypothetical protein BKP42_34010 [Rhodococcus erythropolis]|nr:hypothetical protein BKP42_34010 [Rhodococcus erythropolis]
MTMEPLDCERCGAYVLVEKNSWHHTSTQWRSDSRTTCLEYREHVAPTSIRSGSCSELRKSINRAAVDGRITVPE